MLGCGDECWRSTEGSRKGLRHRSGGGGAKVSQKVRGATSLRDAALGLFLCRRVIGHAETVADGCGAEGAGEDVSAAAVERRSDDARQHHVAVLDLDRHVCALAGGPG